MKQMLVELERESKVQEAEAERMQREAEPKLRLGQRVMHKQEGFRGVVSSNHFCSACSVLIPCSAPA